MLSSTNSGFHYLEINNYYELKGLKRYHVAYNMYKNFKVIQQVKIYILVQKYT